MLKKLLDEMPTIGKYAIVFWVGGFVGMIFLDTFRCIQGVYPC